MTPASPFPSLRQDSLRPFASAIVLEYVGPGALSLRNLAEVLKGLRSSRGPRSVAVVADGFENAALDIDRTQGVDTDNLEITEIDGFVSRITGPPAWATKESDYVETKLELTILASKYRLVAIHCSSALRDAIQRWLDGDPRPSFRRLQVGIINATLLAGEAKLLWLRGAHPRRTTRPDSKTISGARLQDALNPMEDATFAMGSARSEFEAAVHPDLVHLTGVLGTTPRKSLVWIRKSEHFDDFYSTITELLEAFRRSIIQNRVVERPYPWLAAEINDLSVLSGAYEIVPITADQFSSLDREDDELIEASRLLESSVLNIENIVGGPHFRIAAGVDGHIGGYIRGHLTFARDKVLMRFGIDGLPSDEQRVQPVLRALREYPELITIYYQSGHAIINSSIWSNEIRTAKFPNWQWADFDGWAIDREKPDGRTPQDIHSRIGSAGDRSLFSWVLKHYAVDGWLTCDDGPGEVADFVYLRPDSTLELIHVKAAHSRAEGRRVSATAYEIVTSQASKNLGYLSAQKLAERLKSSPIRTPASWYGGVAQGRDELIEYLQMGDAMFDSRVTIIQPHLHKRRVDAARAARDGDAEKLRLSLIETLLNSARASVTSLGAELQVLASV